MHLQRNATQRNATQRNAYHNYILNNNFKFYIFQFFRAFNFLSVFIRFAKIFSFIKESKSSYFFEWQKRTTPKADSRQKPFLFLSLCAPLVKKRNKAKPAEAKTTPFRIRNSLVKTMSLRVKRSNPNFIKFSFYNLISLINKFYTKWIASLIPFVRNDKFKISNDGLKICNDNFNYAFSCALKNKFEIISRNENYAFYYNKYFCRNGNNRIGGRLPRLLTKSRNDSAFFRHSPKASYGNEAVVRDKVGQSPSNPIYLDCHAHARNDEYVGCTLCAPKGDDGIIARKNDLFSRNDYGGKFIFGFGNNFNRGFLFNRKIKK